MICISVSGVSCATFRLLVELLQAILELSQVVDLTLQHLDRVNLLDPLVSSSYRSLLLELPHLVLAADNLMVRLFHATRIVLLRGSGHIVQCGVVLFRFIDDLDRGDIGTITLVILKLHIVVEQEVHETSLLILGQLAEYECLRCRCALMLLLSHVTLAEGGAAACLLAGLAAGRLGTSGLLLLLPVVLLGASTVVHF